MSVLLKLVEKAVSRQLECHLNGTELFSSHQSSYRTHHSTETALNRILNDVYNGFNANQSTVLVALDQSTAFDCIDHSTLLDRLRHTFGITGKALDWLSSYLHGRSSFVRHNNVSSATSAVDTGIAQGSSLGPLLFSTYIAPLS